uniref:Uncharacterized protein n=1 Tax=Meloidogyne enterolobii TaxID=390850 RepID=A0A6V7X6P3_MELEN|nr:unnamed protein product [Meloidogyne enterolobii]
MEKTNLKKILQSFWLSWGLRIRTADEMLKKYSTELITRTVKGMMPHNSISKKTIN